MYSSSTKRPFLMNILYFQGMREAILHQEAWLPVDTTLCAYAIRPERRGHLGDPWRQRRQCPLDHHRGCPQLHQARVCRHHRQQHVRRLQGQSKAQGRTVPGDHRWTAQGKHFFGRWIVPRIKESFSVSRLWVFTQNSLEKSVLLALLQMRKCNQSSKGAFNNESKGDSPTIKYLQCVLFLGLWPECDWHNCLQQQRPRNLGGVDEISCSHPPVKNIWAQPRRRSQRKVSRYRYLLYICPASSLWAWQ